MKNLAPDTLSRSRFSVLHFSLFLLTCPILTQSASAQQPISPADAKLLQTLPNLDGPSFCIAYGSAAGFMAAGCERGTIHLWPTDQALGIRGRHITPTILRGHSGAVTALAWQGATLASAGVDQKLILWSVADQQPSHTLPTNGIVRVLAASPDGKLLAAAGDDPAIQLWDASTGKLVAKLEGHADWVVALAFTPDGKRLASGGYDGVVRIWDVDGRKKLLDIPMDTAPTALAFSPDALSLAVGGNDAKIRLINPADGKVGREISGHGSAITGVAFHPTGAVLASSSRDNTVRLWSLADGKPPKTLDGHTGWVQGLVMVPHGSHVASVAADATVRVWDLAARK